MNYAEMTVAELRAVTKQRELPQQANGKKFTKSELIERLKEYDERTSRADKQGEQKKESPKKKVVFVHRNDRAERITYDKDILPAINRVIEQYEGKCEESKITIGRRVVYVRYIETRSGKIIKKLATAKVVNTKRSSGVARIETPIQTTDVRNFKDFLFVSENEGETYPKEIREVLRMQRIEREQFVREKYGEKE